jgi:hypothetical protein
VTLIRKADPLARRFAILFFIVGAVVGVLLLLAFERYRMPLRDWLLAEPSASAHRITSVFLLLATLLLTPLLAFAVYLWWLGTNAVRAGEFPPPGYRVIRETRVIVGELAVSRGRQLKIAALACIVACAVLVVLLWRLGSAFSGYAGYR